SLAPRLPRERSAQQHRAPTPLKAAKVPKLYRQNAKSLPQIISLRSPNPRNQAAPPPRASPRPARHSRPDPPPPHPPPPHTAPTPLFNFQNPLQNNRPLASFGQMPPPLPPPPPPLPPRADPTPPSRPSPPPFIIGVWSSPLADMPAWRARSVNTL